MEKHLQKPGLRKDFVISWWKALTIKHNLATEHILIKRHDWKSEKSSHGEREDIYNLYNQERESL